MIRPVDRTMLFDGIRTRLFHPSQVQVDGINKIFNKLESDPHIADTRWAAYPLGTVQRESPTFTPISEFGHGHGKAYGIPKNVGGRMLCYYGRGYVQLTWEENYVKATAEVRKQYPDVVAAIEARLGHPFDLHLYPELALDPDVAYCVMSAGMRDGWFRKDLIGRPHRLERYFPADNPGVALWNDARRIINGPERHPDHCEEIGGHACIWNEVILAATPK